MRKIHFCTRTFALIALALIIASCANDETEQENAAKKLDAKGMTEFVVVDDETNAKHCPPYVHQASILVQVSNFTGHQMIGCGLTTPQLHLQ